MKMKFTMILSALFMAAVLNAADFNALIREGNAAQAKKDYNTAAAKFAEAAKLAKKSPEKYQAYAGQLTALRSASKLKEADALVEAVTEDEDIKGVDLRRFINHAASQDLWSHRPQKCFELLQAAKGVQCPTYDNAFFATYYYLGHYYLSRAKKYDLCIQTMQEALKDAKGTHPANSYTAWMLIGYAQEKSGKKKDALESFKTAKSYLKKVTYKVSFAEVDKKIKEMEEAVKKETSK